MRKNAIIKLCIIAVVATMMIFLVACNDSGSNSDITTGTEGTTKTEVTSNKSEETTTEKTTVTEEQNSIETQSETQTETTQTETTSESEEDDGFVTYTVKVTDADGNPIANVAVQMCSADGSCQMPVKTNADGVVTFTCPEGEYTAKIASAPEGYGDLVNVEKTFADGEVEIVISPVAE